MLTSRELSQLRSDAEELLPDTCRIERPVSVKAGGYTTSSWGTAVASAPCRLDPDILSNNAQVVAGREASITKYILTLRWNENIQDGDRVVMLTDNQIYEQTELHDSHSDRMVRRAKVSRIRGG